MNPIPSVNHNENTKNTETGGEKQPTTTITKKTNESEIFASPACTKKDPLNNPNTEPPNSSSKQPSGSLAGKTNSNNRYRLCLQMDTHLRTLQKKRTANFREDETKLLIQLWGSPSIQNKLFLTHRKAPVMRLLAANMQQRGFYRTPDEIKTRIRNLKCLYHRIKRTMACGTGIGTVDPDWPHFKAMDEILSKEYPRKLTDRILEEQMDQNPKFEDVTIKQEVDDIDLDDNDSWATNDSLNSEYEDDSSGTTPAVSIIQKSNNNNIKVTTTNKTNNNKQQQQQLQQGHVQVKKTGLLQTPTILNSMTAGSQIKFTTTTNTTQSGQKSTTTIVPTFQIPSSAQTGQHQSNMNNGTTAKGSIPFPLLILNNLQPQQQQQQNNMQDKNASKVSGNQTNNKSTESQDINNLLKELIDIQKENLQVQKQKLDVEKQRLEYDRIIGTQMVTLIPMLGGLIHRFASNMQCDDEMKKMFKYSPTSEKNKGASKRKRSASEADSNLMNDSKILRSMLEQGIKKYMMVDECEENANEKKSSQNTDDEDVDDEEGEDEASNGIRREKTVQDKDDDDDDAQEETKSVSSIKSTLVTEEIEENPES